MLIQIDEQRNEVGVVNHRQQHLQLLCQLITLYLVGIDILVVTYDIAPHQALHIGGAQRGAHGIEHTAYNVTPLGKEPKHHWQQVSRMYAVVIRIDAPVVVGSLYQHLLPERLGKDAHLIARLSRQFLHCRPHLSCVRLSGTEEGVYGEQVKLFLA